MKDPESLKRQERSADERVRETLFLFHFVFIFHAVIGITAYGIVRLVSNAPWKVTFAYEWMRQVLLLFLFVSLLIQWYDHEYTRLLYGKFKCLLWLQIGLVWICFKHA